MSDLIPDPAPTAAAPVSLGDLLATLTETPTPFVEVALAHPQTPQTWIRSGLLQLQHQRLAFLQYGAGWYRKPQPMPVEDEPDEFCMICHRLGPAGFECPHPDAHLPVANSHFDGNGEPWEDEDQQ